MMARSARSSSLRSVSEKVRKRASKSDSSGVGRKWKDPAWRSRFHSLKAFCYGFPSAASLPSALALVAPALHARQSQSLPCAFSALYSAVTVASAFFLREGPARRRSGVLGQGAALLLLDKELYYAYNTDNRMSRVIQFERKGARAMSLENWSWTEGDRSTCKSCGLCGVASSRGRFGTGRDALARAVSALLG